MLSKIPFKNMRKIFTFVLLFLAIISFSQIIKGKVISSEDSSAVSFAKVGIENLPVGTLTSNNGDFLIDVTEVDKKHRIKIEAAGYNIFVKEISDILKEAPEQILLMPKIINIAEVSIVGKNYKEEKIGSNSKNKRPNIRFASGNSEFVKNKSTDRQPRTFQYPEIAILIDVKKRSKITKINMNFAKFELQNSVLSRFIIYSEKNGFPDQIINSDDLTFTLEKSNIKSNVFTLDVTNKNMWVDGKIFVSYQILDPTFNGEFRISTGFFGTGMLRMFVEQWKKLSTGIAPAINVDVRMEQ